MKLKPYCLWLFGMPNSGKSTIAYHLLQDRLRNVVLIDGDKYRECLSPVKFSFKKQDIVENNVSAAKLAKFLMEQGFNVVVAMITPYHYGRERVQEILGDRLMFVWLDAEQEVRRARPNYRESQIMFEVPHPSPLYLNTSRQTIAECTKAIYAEMERLINKVPELVVDLEHSPIFLSETEE